jgi:hypothetical protein
MDERCASRCDKDSPLISSHWFRFSLSLTLTLSSADRPTQENNCHTVTHSGYDPDEDDDTIMLPRRSSRPCCVNGRWTPTAEIFHATFVTSREETTRERSEEVAVTYPK